MACHKAILILANICCYSVLEAQNSTNSLFINSTSKENSLDILTTDQESIVTAPNNTHIPFKDDLSFQEITNIILIALLFMIIILCIVLIFVVIKRSNSKHKLIRKIMDLQKESVYS